MIEEWSVEVFSLDIKYFNLQNVVYMHFVLLRDVSSPYGTDYMSSQIHERP